MSTNDWFRKNSWSSKDREDFFSRFKRARDYNKPQYLRVQAYYLLTSGKKEEITGALELLDLLINEWPSPIELELAYYTKAQCLEALGRLDQVIEEYRNAFESRRKQPNVRTNAPLGYAMFVIRNNLTDLYDEITAILEELVLENDIIFPIDKYQYFTAFAFIADYRNQKEIAKECAARALQTAEQTYSGFSRHPNVGLLMKKDEKIIAKLRKISRQ
jgi:tetratricopeptide (TPR) repeat protein